MVAKSKSLQRRSIYLCVLSVSSALSLAAAGVQAINTLIPNPSLVYLNSSGATNATVTLVANVAYNATLIPSSVTLNQVNSSGQLIQTLGRMYDDGTHGDAIANDNNFTVQVQVTQLAPITLYYMATAAYSGVIRRSQSSVSPLSFAKPSSSTPPDSSKLVVDPVTNGVLPVNQLVFTVLPGTLDSTVNAIAALVNGTIIGYSSSANMYEVQVPATTLDQLNADVQIIRNNPNVLAVARNYLGTLQGSVVDDLTNLNSISPLPDGAAAYNVIRTIQAYQLLVNTNTPLTPVVVGVADTGVAITHAEFTGVSPIATSSSPASDLKDTNGHGTAVAGIIGANCVSCVGPYVAPQMNGILAGIPGPSLKGLLPYTIASRFIGTSFAEVAPALDDLVASGKADVAVIALSWYQCGTSASSCISPADFATYTTILTTSLQNHQHTTVVVAAGNSAPGGANLDTSPTFPGNLSTQPNVITVGATCAEDPGDPAGCTAGQQRWPTSDYGKSVTISAPGKVDAPLFLGGDGTSPVLQGTSAAAALVAGAAGLLHSINPGLGPTQIRQQLIAGATAIPTDQPIGKRLDLFGSVSLTARPVDVFFLIDTTGSMTNSIKGIQTSAVNIVNGLINNNLNVYFGLAQQRDYPIVPFGDPSCGYGPTCFGSAPYMLVQNISAPVNDPDGLPNIANAINTLFASGGDDIPEAQLPALYQLATGAGQDPGSPTAGDYIPAGMQASWRPCLSSPCGNLRIVILATDAPFHPFAGDADLGADPATPVYPGPSMNATVSALNAKGIKVIGIQPSTEPTALSDLQSVATGTSTFAVQSVDCKGDGTEVIPVGGAIVCQTNFTGLGVDTAIMNAIIGLIQTP